jgi:hypothetical protein
MLTEEAREHHLEDPMGLVYSCALCCGCELDRNHQFVERAAGQKRSWTLWEQALESCVIDLSPSVSSSTILENQEAAVWVSAYKRRDPGNIQYPSK